MSAFSVIEDGAIEIRPSVVGFLGQEMAREVLRITELLDVHFVSRAAVILELKALKDDE